MDSRDGQILAEYLGRQLRNVHLAMLEAQRATRSGHAGMYISSPIAGPLVITTTPTKLTGFDVKLPKENGAVANLANSTLSFQEDGVWAVGVQLQLQVTPITANDTGDVLAYFYNDTLGASAEIIASGTSPRYGSSLTVGGLILAAENPSVIGNEFSLQLQTVLGSPDVIVEQINVMDFYMFRVSNFEYGA